MSFFLSTVSIAVPSFGHEDARPRQRVLMQRVLMCSSSEDTLHYMYRRAVFAWGVIDGTEPVQNSTSRPDDFVTVVLSVPFDRF